MIMKGIKNSLLSAEVGDAHWAKIMSLGHKIMQYSKLKMAFRDITLKFN